MADTINGVPIGDLPGIESVPDDSLLVVEFLGKAYSMPGTVLKQLFHDILDAMGSSVDDVTEVRLTAAIETVLASGKYNGVSPIVEVTTTEDGTDVIHVVDAGGIKDYPISVLGAKNAVQYVKQTLTEEQKAQARENIGATVPQNVSELENDSKYVTEDALEKKGYLTEIPDEYVTDEELEQKDYITEVPTPDLSVNNPDAPGYVKKRTHWKEVCGVDGEVIPETTVSFEDTVNFNTITGTMADGILFNGKYTVTWNGTVYECIGKSSSDGAYIGNGSLMPIEGLENTGEPFCVLMYGGTYYQVFKETVATEDAILKVVGEQVVIWHKLDENYLPDTAKYQADFAIFDSDTLGYVKNRTHGLFKISTMVQLNNDGVLVDGTYYLYKISDAIIADADSLIGAVVSAYSGFLKWTMDKAETINVSYGNFVTQASMGDTVYLVSTTAAAFNAHMGADLLTEDGTYLRWPVITDSTEVGAPVTVETREVYAALSKKYLPPLPSLPVLVGENVEGKEYTIDGQTFTAIWGAEVFNDYETNISTGPYSHAEGSGTTADGQAAHAEGSGTTANRISHAEGYKSKAVGAVGSHAEGYETTANGQFGAHAEGYGTEAGGLRGNHAEGYSTIANGDYGAHAEGVSTRALEYAAHAEGGSTIASGASSHAEGKETTASGEMSHAEGHLSKATGVRSHAEGYSTIAAYDTQHVQGKNNIEDAEGKYAHIVGNGTSDTERSNAHTLDWEGNAWYAGDVYVGGSGQNDETAEKLLKASDVPEWAKEENKPTYKFTEIEGKPTFVGKNVEGVEFPIGNSTLTGNMGAEIFNSDANIAVGICSHAEGSLTQALGFASHAEGAETQANGDGSHAEGKLTIATGVMSHAEGQDTIAYGGRSHAEGLGTRAMGDSQHVQGKYNEADPQQLYAHIVGNGTSDTDRSNAHTLDWDGNAWYAGDVYVGADNKKLSPVGQDVAGQEFELSYVAEPITAADGAEIFNSAANIATGIDSHAEGADTIASGEYSHAEGNGSNARGDSSHAEGTETKAIGSYSHAEGLRAQANGDFGSHAEGADTIASGFSSHAEGNGSAASGNYSHAEGSSKAIGMYSHAEGGGTQASGSGSHSEGSMTKAKGENSHAEGDMTIAAGANQHVQGRYNIEDTEGKYAHIVGNGSDANNRSNAHTVDWNGNAWYAGALTLNRTYQITANADGLILTDTKTGESIPVGNAEIDEAELTAALEEVLS